MTFETLMQEAVLACLLRGLSVGDPRLALWDIATDTEIPEPFWREALDRLVWNGEVKRFKGDDNFMPDTYMISHRGGQLLDRLMESAL